MTVLSIAAASVVPGSNAVLNSRFVAGETITQGMPVYRDVTTQKWMKSDADSATAAAHSAGGIAVNGASLNQPLTVQESGDITLGATLAIGATYCLDTTSGGICPDADVTSGEYKCVLGVARTAAILQMGIINPAIAVA